MILASGGAPPLRLEQLQRAFARLVPAGSVATAGAEPLELIPVGDPALLGQFEPLEPAEAGARAICGDPLEGFAAFLDGTQRTEVVGHTAEGEAVLLGSVGAVIRRWHDRRATTWKHRRGQRIYAPVGILPADVQAAMRGLPLPVVDTVVDTVVVGEVADAHPHARRDVALREVRRMRERLEVDLLTDWVAEERQPLYVDGGLSASLLFPHAANAVGVVKSHHTLYADRDSRRTVLALQGGERGPVFLVGRQRGAPLASWYLRLRSPAAHDPFWGLVRVEVPHDAERPLPALTAHADEVSRRVLAERAPTAHPDARWHTMAYGIRDCEVFLRAVR